MIGEFRNRIKIKSVAITTDAGGGVSSSFTDVATIWAKVENKQGAANYSEGQRQDNYDYKITIRKTSGILITTKNIIEYSAKNLRVESVQDINEGKLFFQVLKCNIHG